jgi:SAM-dependent methyltransferase
LHESYAEDEALPADGYDVVTSTSTFEHIPKPVEHVRSLLRLVRPGGVLYLCGMPNYGSWAVLSGLATFRHNRPPWHANFFTPRSLRAVFEHALNADYLASVRIRTYGVPEAYRFYSRLTRWRAGRKGAGGPSLSGEGTAGSGAVAKMAASSYYLLGRPFQLGDKLEVVARRSATPWSSG